MRASIPGDAVRILLASGDPDLLSGLDALLLAAGYLSYGVNLQSGRLPMLLTHGVAAAIIDISDEGGPPSRFLLHTLPRISTIPCLVITSTGRADQRIAALRAGAWDVMARPISGPELVLRLSSWLPARSPAGDRPATVFVAPGVVVDPANAIIARGDDLTSLTPYERDLLTILLRHSQQVVRHGEICRALGLSSDSSGLSSLRRTVSRLRRKLDSNETGFELVAERGEGYRLRLPDSNMGPSLTG